MNVLAAEALWSRKILWSSGTFLWMEMYLLRRSRWSFNPRKQAITIPDLEKKDKKQKNEYLIWCSLCWAMTWVERRLQNWHGQSFWSGKIRHAFLPRMRCNGKLLNDSEDSEICPKCGALGLSEKKKKPIGRRTPSRSLISDRKTDWVCPL